MTRQNLETWTPACKQNDNPRQWLSVIDYLPPDVRRALHEATRDWCAACVNDFWCGRGSVHLVCELIRSWDREELRCEPPPPLRPRKVRKPGYYVPTVLPR